MTPFYESDTGAIKFLTSKPKGFTLSNVFIGIGEIGNHSLGSVGIGEVSVSSDLGPEFLGLPFEFSQGKHSQGALFLDSKEWQDGLYDFNCGCIACLKAKQGLPLLGARLLGVVPASKRFREKLDCPFINHADLDYP